MCIVILIPYIKFTVSIFQTMEALKRIKTDKKTFQTYVSHGLWRPKEEIRDCDFRSGLVVAAVAMKGKWWRDYEILIQDWKPIR